MTAQSSRVWLVAGAAVAVLIVVASWFLVISPVRADTQTLRDDTETVETQNTALLAKLNALKDQDAQRDDLIQSVRESLAALPAEVALPEFNRQVVRQASDRGVELISISVGTATSPAQDPQAPVDPAAPATGLLSVPITIETKGSALDQLYFLRDLQQVGPRRALVSSTALASGSDETDADVYTMTTQLDVFSSSLSDTDRAQLAEVLGDDLTG